MSAISFSSIVVQPQNREQISTLSQVAYKTKETIEKRFGAESPILIKANISKDTAVFSSTGTNKAGQNSVDSIMQFYLRRTNIPFRRI